MCTHQLLILSHRDSLGSRHGRLHWRPKYDSKRMYGHLEQDTGPKHTLGDPRRSYPEESGRAAKHQHDRPERRPHVVPPGEMVVVKVLRIHQGPQRVNSDLRKPDDPSIPDTEESGCEEESPSFAHKLPSL